MDKRDIIYSFFRNRVGVLATMHKKEQVILPILERELGVKIVVPEGLDTDQFGTFTGDIKRTGDQLEAARYKAEAAMSLCGVSLAFASEGTFGPHPVVPFVPFNREIVVLVDKENNMEITGMVSTLETNYKHKVVRNLQEAYGFAVSAGFPQHGVVVKTCQSTTDPSDMIKGITTLDELKSAVEIIAKKSSSGDIYIETDMRALYNPTRMKNIEAATLDLVKNVHNVCPKCLWPGFRPVERRAGLPCSWCGLPTELTLSLVYNCTKCGCSEERFHPDGREKADPGRCQYCNP